MNTITNNSAETPVLKVGDIFHWRWGYGNNYFYRVEKVKPRSVSLKRIDILSKTKVNEDCKPDVVKFAYDFGNLEYKYYNKLEENGKPFLSKRFAMFTDWICVNKKYISIKSYYLKGFDCGFCKLVRGKTLVV